MSFHRSCVVLLLLTLSAMTTVLQAAGANPCEWECDEPVNLEIVPDGDYTICEGDDNTGGGFTIVPTSGDAVYVKVGDGCSGTKTETKDHPGYKRTFDEYPHEIVHRFWWLNDYGPDDCITTGEEVTQTITILPLECIDPPAEGEWQGSSGVGDRICLDPLVGTVSHTLSAIAGVLNPHIYGCDGEERGEDGSTAFGVKWSVSGPGVIGDASGNGDSVTVKCDKEGVYTVTFSMVDKSSDQEYCGSAVLPPDKTLSFEVLPYDCDLRGILLGPTGKGSICAESGKHVSFSALAGGLVPPMRECDGATEEMASGWTVEHRWVLKSYLNEEVKTGDGLVFSHTFDSFTGVDSGWDWFQVQFQSRFAKVGKGPLPCVLDEEWVNGDAVEVYVPTDITVTEKWQSPNLIESLGQIAEYIDKAPYVDQTKCELTGSLSITEGWECCGSSGEPTAYGILDGRVGLGVTTEIGLGPWSGSGTIWQEVSTPEIEFWFIDIPSVSLFTVAGKYSYGPFVTPTFTGSVYANGKLSEECPGCVKIGVSAEGTIKGDVRLSGELWVRIGDSDDEEDGDGDDEKSYHAKIAASIAVETGVGAKYEGGFNCPDPAKWSYYWKGIDLFAETTIEIKLGKWGSFTSGLRVQVAKVDGGSGP